MYAKAYTLDDVTYLEGLVPAVSSLTEDVRAQTLVGNGYKLIVINNISAAKEKVSARIKVEFPITGATVRTFEGDVEAKIEGNIICVEGVTDGAIIVIK